MLFKSQHYVNVYTIKRFLHLKIVYNELNEILENINEYNYFLLT